MKNYKPMRSSKTNPSLFDEVIKVYRKENGQLNKLAIFISILALILVLMLGHTMINAVKDHLGLNMVAASELTLEEISDEVTNSFISALDGYVDGNYTQEELKEKLLSLLGEYINSSGYFTEKQLNELNHAMEEYLLSTTIYSDISKNHQAIDDLKALIEEKYNCNFAYISAVKIELQSLLNSNKDLDDTRYNEIMSIIGSINSWINGEARSDFANLQTQINELVRELADLKSLENDHYLENQQHIQNLEELQNALYNENLAYIQKIEEQQNAQYAENQESIKNLEEQQNSQYAENQESIKDLEEQQKSQYNSNQESIKNLENDTYTTIANYFGLSGWSADVTYSNTAYVSYNQKFYHSLIDSNIGNEPASSPSAWEEVDIITLFNKLQSEIEVIDSHISDLNNQDYKFQYGCDENGSVGYYINGQFKPF